MKLKKIFKVLIIVCLILIIIDQFSKILIKNYINNDINIGLLTITKVENNGIAFGLNKNNMQNVAISVVVITIIIRYIISQKDKLNNRIVVYLGFIIAGGFSNVIDRIFRGAVFDFIKIGEFPVFNFADVFIVLRLVIICNKFLEIFCKRNKD